MNIAVIGANGAVGSLVVQEAIARGHEVTAITRSPIDRDDARNIVRDVFELQAEDLAGIDVIVDAFGVYDPERLPQHKSHFVHLEDVITPEQRLIVVGSAGGLFADESRTTRVLESPQMPEEFKPLALAMLDGFLYLQDQSAINWTYVSPPLDFRPDGPRAGAYQLGDDVLRLSANGESTVSYADYAIAILDEAELPADQQHRRQRIGVVDV